MSKREIGQKDTSCLAAFKCQQAGKLVDLPSQDSPSFQFPSVFCYAYVERKG